MVPLIVSCVKKNWALRCASLFIQKNFQTSSTKNNEQELLSIMTQTDTIWSSLIKDAEAVTGVETSFANVRCLLLNNEIVSVYQRYNKMLGNSNITSQNVERVIFGDSRNLHPYGFTIFLLSKSVNRSLANLNQIEEMQRHLAEAIELLKSGHRIHQNVVNIPLLKMCKKKDSAVAENKMIVLIGDYVFSIAYETLTKIRNRDVIHIIFSGFMDMCNSEFIGERDEQNFPLPNVPRETKNLSKEASFDKTMLFDDVLGQAEKEWTMRNILSGASFLGMGCKGSMMLNQQDRRVQEDAYIFGCHAALAWQAAFEYKVLISDDDKFSLVTAPVLFALDEKPNLYKLIEENKHAVKGVDFENLKENILKTDALEKTIVLYETHAAKAIDYLERIGKNEIVEIIKKAIKTF